jgi:hypothetical protein
MWKGIGLLVPPDDPARSESGTAAQDERQGHSQPSGDAPVTQGDASPQTTCQNIPTGALTEKSPHLRHHASPHRRQPRASASGSSSRRPIDDLGSIVRALAPQARSDSRQCGRAGRALATRPCPPHATSRGLAAARPHSPAPAHAVPAGTANRPAVDRVVAGHTNRESIVHDVAQCREIGPGLDVLGVEEAVV